MADPQTSARRLNLADQVLVNALAAIVLRVVHDADREKMWVDVLREILPSTSEEHPQMMDVIEAAKGFFDGPVLDATREVSAKWRAGAPLVQFFEKRAALALDAFRVAKTGGADV